MSRGRKCALVLADDVGLLEIGVWLQQRRAVGVSACQWPRAVVDAQFDDAPVLVTVRHDGSRQFDATLLAVERQHRLLDPAPWRDDSLHMAADSVARGQPGVGFGHEPLEGAASLDAAYRGRVRALQRHRATGRLDRRGAERAGPPPLQPRRQPARERGLHRQSGRNAFPSAITHQTSCRRFGTNPDRRPR